MTPKPQSNQISEIVIDLLNQLEEAPVDMPIIGKINLIDGLRRLGRSGKLVRIVHFNLNLPIQSHYDHVLSVARLADVYAAQSGIAMNDQIDIAKAIAFHSLTNRQFVACCIAFHDLSEVIVGDVPDFTSRELTDGVLDFLSPFSIGEANQYIAAGLPNKLGNLFRETTGRIEAGQGDTYRFFKMVDRIEPIVAIWRYIVSYRDSMDIERFLLAMTDFFTNPRPAASCVNEMTRETLAIFQNKECARQYFLSGKNGISSVPILAREVVENMVERHPIESIIFS